MVNLQLDWQQSTVLSGALIAAAAAARRRPRLMRSAPYLGEAAIIAALYTLWQLAASLSVMSTADAYRRGRWIEHAQRRAGLPSEATVQHLILGHPIAAQLCNLYYASMHFAMLGVFLAWLFARHRAVYPRVRTVLVILTASSLAIQLLPVAPPRLLPELGIVDVAARYGQSVYQLSGVTVDELGAMPSVHVGWALLIGWAVLRHGRGRWRFLALAHPVATVFVVIATGNHFWLDGIVAAALLVCAIVIVEGVTRSRRHHRRPEQQPVDREQLAASMV